MKDHREMTKRDDDPAYEYGKPCSQEVISNEAARQGSQIHRHCVSAINGGRMFCVEPQPTLGHGSCHVKHKDGPHTVVTESFPKLSEKQRSETFGMTGKSRCI